MLGLGIKEIPPVKGPKYFVNSYSFNMIKQGKAKSSYGFGVDAFYNSSLRDLILTKDENYQTTRWDYYRLGVVGIYSLDFGDISLLIEAGGYLFTPHKKQGYIYNRVTTRYNVGDRLFLNLGLKTHFAVAAFVEFGLGYNLHK